MSDTSLIELHIISVLVDTEPGVLARVIDIFRAWDEDGSGTVSKKEFAQSLPMLGLKVSS